MRTIYCPDCGRRLVPQNTIPCEYRKNKFGWVSGCGVRVPWNKTWHFCPICGRSICKMGWKEGRDND